jgi:ATP-dependent exoDNAse (exonuclease V) alpha subunit
VSLSGQATLGLAEGAGIRSYTLGKLLGVEKYRYRGDFERGLWDRVKHDLRMLGRAALKKKTWRYERVRLSTKSIVVLDEAAMVGTARMKKLIRKVRSAGAKLILVGDAGQFQPIDAGQPFARIARMCAGAELKTIVRQKEAWARQAVADLAEGNAQKALAAYAEHGLVHVADTRAATKEALIAQWRTRGVANPKDHVIIAATNRDVDDLNRKAQAEMLLAGKLGRLSVAIEGARAHAGDRVLFTRNDRRVGMMNGTLGSVRHIDPLAQKLRVRLDSGRSVTVALKDYGRESVRLGYCATTHKLQGHTVRGSAYCLAGGPMADQHLAYVQASRAERETRWFCDRLEAGEDLAALARQMSQSRVKELAHDVLEQSQRRLASAGLTH